MQTSHNGPRQQLPFAVSTTAKGPDNIPALYFATLDNFQSCFTLISTVPFQNIDRTWILYSPAPLPFSWPCPSLSQGTKISKSGGTGAQGGLGRRGKLHDARNPLGLEQGASGGWGGKGSITHRPWGDWGRAGSWQSFSFTRGSGTTAPLPATTREFSSSS